MPRIAFLVILFAVAVGAVFVLTRAVKGALVAQENLAGQRGGNMQRLAFFLLLALIAYVAASGGM